jgi:hypothetical protein
MFFLHVVNMMCPVCEKTCKPSDYWYHVGTHIAVLEALGLVKEDRLYTRDGTSTPVYYYNGRWYMDRQKLLRKVIADHPCLRKILYIDGKKGVRKWHSLRHKSNP